MLIPFISMLRNEEGATMVEYSLIVALIAVVCIAGVTVLGGKINTNLTASGNAL